MSPTTCSAREAIQFAWRKAIELVGYGVHAASSPWFMATSVPSTPRV